MTPFPHRPFHACTFPCPSLLIPIYLPVFHAPWLAPLRPSRPCRSVFSNHSPKKNLGTQKINHSKSEITADACCENRTRTLARSDPAASKEQSSKHNMPTQPDYSISKHIPNLRCQTSLLFHTLFRQSC